MQRGTDTTNQFRATRIMANEAVDDLVPIPGSNPNLIPIPVRIPTQAKNHLLNGDASHSVCTWNDAPPPTGDRNEECAWWFTNDAPSLGQVLATATSPTTPNQTLKTDAHSTYDPDYADWDAAAGSARFGSDKTIDLQLPGRIVLPSRTYYVSFIIAKANAYIVFPNTAYIYAGFWLNNGVSSYWVQGQNPFTLTGASSAVYATTRKYKIFARTDRATSFLSTELTLTDAPSTAQFAAGGYVSLAWDRLGDIGIISYDVYRLTGGVYELLQQVESGANTYLDNDVALTTVAGYPTPTDDRSTALTTTRTQTTESVLNSLFIDGVSSQWSTLSFPIPVPFGYDAGTPAVSGDDGLQWLRLGIGGISGAPDLSIPEVQVSLGKALESDAGVFRVDMIGMTAVLSDLSGGGDYTVTIDTFADADNIEITPSVPDGDYSMYISGGAGNQCLLLDCVHQSFGDGATYGANDNDLTPPRPQFPRAAPNGSGQGGAGIGGGPTDGGGPLCVEINEPVLVLYGNQVVEKRAGDISVGDVLESGNIEPNVVLTPPRKYGCPDLWFLEAENGCSLLASPSHPVYRGRLDKTGTPMQDITTRMNVLTRYGTSKVKSCAATGRAGTVVMISCGPTPSFIAGNGIICHNNKPADIPVDGPRF